MPGVEGGALPHCQVGVAGQVSPPTSFDTDKEEVSPIAGLRWRSRIPMWPL